jgi:pyruvate formate lyase activating enzyme
MTADATPTSVKVPYIVEVKRGSEADGPGLRSVVFFKGCPLRCVFCHNPETQDSEPEIAFNDRLCIDCRRCRTACPNGATEELRRAPSQRLQCQRCGACAEICPTGALRRIGRRFEVDELFALLLQDEPFYRQSGGGVTFSGGECTLFPDYLEAIGTRLKSAGIHLAIQTNGLFAWGTFRDRILPWVDLVFYDLKVIEPEACRRVTGASSETVLANLIQLLESQVAVEPTIPLVPGVTATAENLSALGGFLRSSGVRSITPRPWNPLGIDHYRQLGRSSPEQPERFLKPEEERALLGVFRTAICGCNSDHAPRDGGIPGADGSGK